MGKGPSGALTSCAGALALGLAAVLCLFVCGCGKGTGSEDAGRETIVADEEGEAAQRLSSSKDDQTADDLPQGTMTNTGSYGTCYTRQDLVDTQLNAPVFNAFMPDGWHASVSSDWSCVSPMYPGFEMVTLTSPDGEAAINVASCLHFTQSAYNNDGTDYETYTTYADYMDAGTYTDASVSNAFGQDAALLTELPEDQDTVDALWQYLNQIVESMNQQTADGQLGVPMSVEAHDVSACRRQYQVGEGYIETTVAGYAFGQAIEGYVPQEYLHWFVPYNIVYIAESEEAFKAHYGEYELIVANSYFTPQLFSAESYVSSMRAARAMEAKNAASQFSSSGYESPDADLSSRSVAEQWDDVIREMDTYQTLTGDYVQVPMGDDVVAQDGDMFYVGPSYDIPPGFEQLSAK